MQTRLDITFAISTLAKYINNPIYEHLAAGKRVLRYLKGKLNLSIVFTGSDDDALRVEGFTDALYADNIDTARSTGGYLFKYVGSIIL